MKTPQREGFKETEVIMSNLETSLPTLDYVERDFVRAGLAQAYRLGLNDGQCIKEKPSESSSGKEA